MDLVRQARGLMLAIRAGGDVVQYLHPDLRFHRGEQVWNREELLPRLERLKGRLVPGDALMRRNLVVAGWETESGSGTWILSFDREGHVVEWTEVSR